MKIRIKHDLENYEVEEALEKALRGLRQKEDREADFADPYMADMFRRTSSVVDKLMEQMSEKIADILKFSP